MSKHLHLAGIIPIANYDDTFGMEYPWYLLPVDQGFSMIQKSVFCFQKSFKLLKTSFQSSSKKEIPFE